MLGVGWAAAIPEENDLAAVSESLRRVEGKRLDAFQQFVGKILLYATTLTQMRKDGVTVGSHACSAQHNFAPITDNPARDIASVDDQFGGFHDCFVVVAGV